MTEIVPAPPDDQAAPPTEPQGQTASKRRRAAGLTGQTVGIIGIVVSLVLVIGVILGRGWLVGQVDEVAGAIDSTVARALTLVDATDAKVTEVGDQVTATLDAAEAVAADRAASSELLQGLLNRVNGVSERYLALRDAYAGLREGAVSALDRLQLLGRLVPGFSVPQGPVDALTALDQQIQAFDAAVMPLISAGTGRADEAAQAIADRSRLADQAVGSIQAGLDTMRGRLDGMRTDVAAFADTLSNVITFGAIALVLALLYIAFLHLVLFRAGRGYRNAPTD
jgi:hypothetical protein